MMRFPHLERHGLVAAISGKADGDCGAWARRPGERRAFLAQLSLQGQPLYVPAQVHGAQIHVVTLNSPSQEVDGVVTTCEHLTLGITVADCVPLFFLAPDIRAIGLAHAGREGTFRNIAAAAVHTLTEQLGADPGEILAVIGPAAGLCCYEVSEDIAEDWEAQGLPARGRYLDLWHANYGQLLQAGLVPENIHVTRICTICTPDFHSFRADGSTARNLAVMQLTGPPQ